MNYAASAAPTLSFVLGRQSLEPVTCRSGRAYLWCCQRATAFASLHTRGYCRIRSCPLVCTNTTWSRPLSTLQGKAGSMRSNVQLYSLMRQGERMLKRTEFVSRTILAHKLHIPFRELSLIDPRFQDHNPVVFIRNGSILFRLSEISGIVKHNHLYLFRPDEPSVSAVIAKIDAYLQKDGADDEKKYEKLHDFEMENKEIPWDNKGFDGAPPHQQDLITGNGVTEMGSSETELLPFELYCIDICMQEALQVYEKTLEHLTEDFDSNLELSSDREALSSFSKELLVYMMTAKNDIQRLGGMLHGLRSSVEKILNEDEDMEAIHQIAAHSSRFNRDMKDHSQVEVLYETYLQQLENLCSELTTLQQRMMNHEELMRLYLDIRRNDFIRVEVRISLFALTCSIAALLTGILGMNLSNWMENNPYAFWIVSGCVVLPTASSGFLLYKPLFNLLSRSGFASPSTLVKASK